VKYSLMAAPGAIDDRIWLRYRGVAGLEIVEDGRALRVNTGFGLLREGDLRCYQVDLQGRRREVPARYQAVRAGDAAGDWEYAIQLENVDPELPLVVDPVIE
jgi:hypothetical protein